MSNYVYVSVYRNYIWNGMARSLKLVGKIDRVRQGKNYSVVEPYLQRSSETTIRKRR